MGPHLLLLSFCLLCFIYPWSVGGVTDNTIQKPMTNRYNSAVTFDDNDLGHALRILEAQMFQGTQFADFSVTTAATSDPAGRKYNVANLTEDDQALLKDFRSKVVEIVDSSKDTGKNKFDISKMILKGSVVDFYDAFLGRMCNNAVSKGASSDSYCLSTASADIEFVHPMAIPHAASFARSVNMYLAVSRANILKSDTVKFSYRSTQYQVSCFDKIGVRYTEKLDLGSPYEVVYCYANGSSYVVAALQYIFTKDASYIFDHILNGWVNVGNPSTYVSIQPSNILALVYEKTPLLTVVNADKVSALMTDGKKDYRVYFEPGVSTPTAKSNAVVRVEKDGAYLTSYTDSPLLKVKDNSFGVLGGDVSKCTTTSTQDRTFTYDVATCTASYSESGNSCTVILCPSPLVGLLPIFKTPPGTTKFDLVMMKLDNGEHVAAIFPNALAATAADVGYAVQDNTATASLTAFSYNEASPDNFLQNLSKNLFVKKCKVTGDSLDKLPGLFTFTVVSLKKITVTQIAGAVNLGDVELDCDLTPLAGYVGICDNDDPVKCPTIYIVSAVLPLVLQAINPLFQPEKLHIFSYTTSISRVDFWSHYGWFVTTGMSFFPLVDNVKTVTRASSKLLSTLTIQPDNLEMLTDKWAANAIKTCIGRMSQYWRLMQLTTLTGKTVDHVIVIDNALLYHMHNAKDKTMLVEITRTNVNHRPLVKIMDIAREVISANLYLVTGNEVFFNSEKWYNIEGTVIPAMEQMECKEFSGADAKLEEYMPYMLLTTDDKGLILVDKIGNAASTMAGNTLTHSYTGDLKYDFNNIYKHSVFLIIITGSDGDNSAKIAEKVADLTGLACIGALVTADIQISCIGTLVKPGERRLSGSYPFKNKDPTRRSLNLENNYLDYAGFMTIKSYFAGMLRKMIQLKDSIIAEIKKMISESSTIQYADTVNEDTWTANASGVDAPDDQLEATYKIIEKPVNSSDGGEAKKDDKESSAFSLYCNYIPVTLSAFGILAY